MDSANAPVALHVVQLTDNLKVGGVQKVVTNLSKLLSSSSVKTSVIASSEGDLWNQIDPDAVAYSAPPRKGFVNTVRYIKWLRRTLLQSDCDIVHAHQRRVALFAKVATVATGIAVVEHVHSVFNSHRLLSFHGDLLIACGSSVRDILVNKYNKKPSRVITILNSVPDLAPNGPDPVPCLVSSRPRILGIGRLTSDKDPLKFVRVISCLNSEDDLKVDATWVGDGELRDQAERLAKELGTRGLNFVGNQSSIESFVKEADVLLMTSRREGLPLVILEVMSMGRGVIAPNVGSCGDAIVNDRNGILYDASIDAAQIAEIIRHRITPKELQAWGTESRQFFMERFHPNEALPQLLDAYRNVLARKR